MNRLVSIKLKEKANEIARRYSSPDRKNNYNNEVFSVNKIVPLSESTAVVYFLKNTGKKSLAFFYYINMDNGYWNYFFPTDSHILGMSEFKKFKEEVEFFNFDKNL